VAAYKIAFRLASPAARRWDKPLPGEIPAENLEALKNAREVCRMSEIKESPGSEPGLFSKEKEGVVSPLACVPYV
jgi:hypothetical protein